MCIFQSEQVIRFTNVLISVEKSNCHRIRQTSNNWIIILWGTILGRYQKYTQDPSNIAELKTALLSTWNDLQQEFIGKAILSFRKRLRRFDRVLLQMVDVLNNRFKYRDVSWHSSLKSLNLWRKGYAKFDWILLNVQDATACSLEKV